MKPNLSHSRAYPASWAIVAGAFFLMPLSAETVAFTDDADYESLAARLVQESARVTEGDQVWISGSARDAELLEDLATWVRVQGAYPLVEMRTGRMNRRRLVEVPPEFDGRPNELHMKLAELADVHIQIDRPEAFDDLADVDMERQVAVRQADACCRRRAVDHRMRIVEVGNGLFPTPARAGWLDLPLGTLSRAFWSSLNADPSHLHWVGDRLRRQLVSGQALRVTDANGTDLHMRIGRRPVLINDGVLAMEDLMSGGSANIVRLPAGEVLFTPLQESVEGVLVIDRDRVMGHEIRNLRVRYSQGVLVDLQADRGLEAVEELYNLSEGGKERLGYVIIGINPHIQATAKGPVPCTAAQGMVTVGVGDNTCAGGKNSTAFSLTGFLPTASLSVADHDLVRHGHVSTDSRKPWHIYPLWPY